MAPDSFDAFFHAATGHPPYDYQRRLATDSPPDSGGGHGVVVRGFRSLLVHLPAGARKTAATPLGRARGSKAERGTTLRRVVYRPLLGVLADAARNLLNAPLRGER